MNKLGYLFISFIVLLTYIILRFNAHTWGRYDMNYIQNYSELDSCVLSTNLLPNEKTKYTKVVDLNPNRHDCKVNLTDKEIIQKCKTNIWSLKGLELKYPNFKPASASFPKHELQGKYQRRVLDGGCSLPKGMWGNPFNSRCTLVTMATIGRYQPNDLILDWGSGCGHQATWMTRLYGVRVLGIDLNEEAVKWSQMHSTGTFYATDGVNLSWIPDNTFDHFFSFAAVYYVPPNKVCSFGQEVVRILKPNGTALFGWLSGMYSQPYGYQPKSVWNCVGDIDGVTMEIYDDDALWDLRGRDLISNTNSYSVIIHMN